MGGKVTFSGEKVMRWAEQEDPFPVEGVKDIYNLGERRWEK